MRIGLLHSRIRVEEKLLLSEFEKIGADVEMIDARRLVLALDDPGPMAQFDVVLDRCLSHSQSLTVATSLEHWGIPCVNSAEVNRLCGNKIDTSAKLLAAGVPTIPVKVAMTPETALEAIESMGYPVVLKPPIGSWGRLLTKVNDRDSAEAILEHKSVLGSVNHSLFYIQPYIDKGSSDIRTFVVGDETICGVRRRSEHWITNTARGATTEKCEITPTIDRLSRDAAAVAGGGMLAVDLFETASGELLVNEINSSMEFRNSSEPTGVNIPARMAEYVVAQARVGGAAS